MSPPSRSSAVGVEAAVEAVEVLVLVEGVGVDLRGLGVALTAQLLGFLVGIGQGHGALAVGVGTDRSASLRALGTQVRATRSRSARMR